LLPWPLVIALALAAAGCGRRASQTSLATATPAASQSLRAYRDPSSGAFGEPPPGAAPVTPTAAPVALTEEAAPGGGRMIRLKGAFRSHMVGRMDGNAASVSCASLAPAQGGTATAARP
jgi:hypothetical protein